MVITLVRKLLTTTRILLICLLFSACDGTKSPEDSSNNSTPVDTNLPLSSGANSSASSKPAAVSSMSSSSISPNVISSKSAEASSSANSSSTNSNVMAFAGRDLVMKSSSLVTLDGTGSLIPENVKSRFKWTQTKGGAVVAQRNSNTATYDFIAPVTQAPQTLSFTLEVTGNANTSQDDIEVDVLPCDDPQGSIFSDCIRYPFGPFLAYEALADGTGQTKYFGESGHVQWALQAHSNRGQVVEVSWNKSDRKNTSADNGWFGVNVQTKANDLSGYKDGAISFDLKMLNNTDVSVPLYVRLDCGPSCRSDDFVIRPSKLGKDWRTFTMPLIMFSASGMDLSKALRFLIWPQWNKQAHYVQLQLDNIRLSQTYKLPTPKDACPGTGEVSFTLVRKSNPTVQEQNAYQRINTAMTEATQLYNCYTSLKRAVTVNYDPAVATANASHSSGIINFGGSISTRVALHEYGHIFGVGFGHFNSWIVEGKFTGPRVSALIKKIENNPAAFINGGGTHIWPHGLNFDREDGNQERIHHCLIVEALASDIKKRGPTQ